MSNSMIFFLVSSVVLIGIIPILVVRDFRNGKKVKDVFFSQ